MAFDTERQVYRGTAVSQAEYSEGLRQHMLRVYNYMTGGLALTGVIAFVVSQTPSLFYATMNTPLKWVIMLAPLALVFFFAARIHSMSFSAAQITFWIFSALMGLSLSYIFVLYTGASVARVFFITAGAFAGLSIFGYTTKKDLSGWGSFLFIGLIGIIIAMIVNIFLASSALHFAISVIGVLIFAGLTAYDTQRIKEEYSEGYGHEAVGKLAIWGALKLYLDFLNMFLFLLQLFGSRE
jgi:FtsH-binding integral membrane protein